MVALVAVFTVGETARSSAKRLEKCSVDRLRRHGHRDVYERSRIGRPGGDRLKSRLPTERGNDHGPAGSDAWPPRRKSLVILGQATVSTIRCATLEPCLVTSHPANGLHALAEDKLWLGTGSASKILGHLFSALSEYRGTTTQSEAMHCPAVIAMTPPPARSPSTD